MAHCFCRCCAGFGVRDKTCWLPGTRIARSMKLAYTSSPSSGFSISFGCSSSGFSIFSGCSSSGFSMSFGDPSSGFSTSFGDPSSGFSGSAFSGMDLGFLGDGESEPRSEPFFLGDPPKSPPFFGFFFFFLPSPERMLTIGRLSRRPPYSPAQSKGVLPSLSLRVLIAPLERRNFRTSFWLNCAALCKGVRPFLFAALISQPHPGVSASSSLFAKSFTNGRWPFSLAKCKGRDPNTVSGSFSAPLLRSMVTDSSCPLFAPR
mmetsp:Transcript_62123/g.122020  ORF Transcript_62123/g.122020 Transcript_62123/m.122020 type:complete len:261 (+) Transcript_62123:105-887(+)